ncbi:MAG: hypothetical protein HY964_08495 [Ignavibacteriales bacterium]|nr:hypothetical protein [Ignavibacteriales bacterium]
MKSKIIFGLLFILSALASWGCKDTPPVSAGGNSLIQGYVFDAVNGNYIQNASAILTTEVKNETTFTDETGKFLFSVEIGKLQNQSATVTIQKFGYLTQILSISVASDTTFSVGLAVDNSTFAVIVGTIRDSLTSYPLRGTKVHLTVPGSDTSMVTEVDGSFRLTADLVDLQTLAALVTVEKSGYRTKQIPVTLLRGQTTNLGNVLISVDLGSSAAQVMGRILDNKTRLPINNANVVLSAGSFVDSVGTSINGDFSFTIDLGGLNALNGQLRVSNPGYITRAFNIVIEKAKTLDVQIILDRDTTASSALIIGTLRDSLTLYPLRGGTILLTLPGVVDSITTPTDGTFRLTADLVDRDSLPVLITGYKGGYRTKRISFMIHRGQTTDLGDFLLAVDAASTVAQVVGRVFDSQSRLPLNNAWVTLYSNLITDSLQTDFSGEYSFSVNLQGLPSLLGLLKAEKSGYKQQSINFNVEAGKQVTYDFYLVRDTTTGIRDSSDTGLYARSIALLSISAKEISVYGVGGTESSIITWEVRDSLGFPIDIDHRDTVEFQLMGEPVAGGAYVTPARALTNVSGRVATTVNSGTKSGVLQFVAKLYRERDSVWIYSTPVIITVNAGLPDQPHFSLAAYRYNFPAYDWLGRNDAITVQLGDKYSNPVKTNTAVYFSSTGGIIGASGFTDKNGQAVVQLQSGNPHPPDTIYGIPNMAKIAAVTMGENGVAVHDTIVILFSGWSQISNVSADSFYVPRGGRSGRIYYKVSDRFGNPLCGGTHIGISLQYTPPPNSQVNLNVTGFVNVTLGDTQARGLGTTDFWFEVVDQTQGGVSSAIPANVIISVSSENGNPPDVSIPGIIGG